MNRRKRRRKFSLHTFKEGPSAFGLRTLALKKKSLRRSEWRSLDVSMDGPSEEGEEQEDETETKSRINVFGLRSNHQQIQPKIFSLRIIDFDCGEGPSAEEPKTAELSEADVWSDRIVSFVRDLREFKRTEELTAILAARNQSHAAELARRAKELADCEAVQTLELERGKKLDADCSRLQSHLSAVGRGSNKIGGN
ncbi:hypothetical protein AXG93_1247s1250 [Marchantia polymorpha subsp. ruderalis]|uniref:Uncharacterized protein n=1 Tax=Marchantia polymorpha subsp. ruderalis TaxID=1480154 RepID=A0A176WQG8_MARPO|nr:hypothetical protein AXG93_1247s1250 [Marchantia polymorpha subsp. ruderalis]